MTGSGSPKVTLEPVGEAVTNDLVAHLTYRVVRQPAEEESAS